MLDKLLAAFKPKQQEEDKQEVVITEETEQEDVAPVVLDATLVAEWETRLTAFVYDSELATELAPVFVKMAGNEGFDRIIELLETKEKQIEAISTNYKQQSNPETKIETQEVKPQTATDILKARYQQS